MANDDKPIANPWVVLREEFDDWAILFDPETGSAVGINPSAVFIWKLLDGEQTLDAILRAVREYAEDVTEDVRDQIEAFVDELVAAGLARVDSSGR